ncbi:MAG: hypothetical protein ACRDHU_14460 [Actinomycetota bacterium]
MGRADELFERVADRFLGDPAVSGGTGFGASPGLRVGGKVFAMLVEGELVVKLPKDRVDQLVESGAGTKFDPGHGRRMKEWVTVSARRGRQWAPLASEAFEFVGSAAPRPPRR